MRNDVGVLLNTNRGAFHGWLLSIGIHGFLGLAVLFTIPNVVVIKKSDPFKMTISLIKAPPQPVEQKVVKRQRVEHTPNVKRVVQEKKIVEAPIPKHQVLTSQPVEKTSAAQRVLKKRRVAQVAFSQEIIEKPHVERTSIQQQVMSVTETVKTLLPQQQDVADQRVQRSVSSTPVARPVVTEARSRLSHHAVSTITTVKTKTAKPTTSRPAIQNVAVVARNGSKPTEHAVEQIPSSIKHVPAIMTGAIRRSSPDLENLPTQTIAAPRLTTPVHMKTPSEQSIPRQVIQRRVVTKKQPSVVTREVKQDPMPAADYRWVADTLLEKVQRLKRYPTRARRKVWEGTVELRVLIKANGEIQDVRVLESSGHNLLDQEALHTIKMASPLTLHHPINHPVVMVDLPIVYKLN